MAQSSQVLPVLKTGTEPIQEAKRLVCKQITNNTKKEKELKEMYQMVQQTMRKLNNKKISVFVPFLILYTL